MSLVPLSLTTVASTSTKDLVVYYNMNSGKKPIKKFVDRPTAVARVTALLEAAKPSPMKTIVATVTSKKTAPAKKPAAPVGRALFTDAAVITIVHKGDNPKRGPAAERYALYRDGMTVAEYIARGGTRRDVVWDAFHQGWIKVTGTRA